MKKRFLVGLLAALMTLGLSSCASDGKTPYNIIDEIQKRIAENA